MATVKATFTLDEQTVSQLQEASQRLVVPRSVLRDFDELVPRIPSRPAAAVDREPADLRKPRRAGGRRHRP